MDASPYVVFFHLKDFMQECERTYPEKSYVWVTEDGGVISILDFEYTIESIQQSIEDSLEKLSELEETHERELIQEFSLKLLEVVDISCRLVSPPSTETAKSIFNTLVSIRDNLNYYLESIKTP